MIKVRENIILRELKSIQKHTINKSEYSKWAQSGNLYNLQIKKEGSPLFLFDFCTIKIELIIFG